MENNSPLIKGIGNFSPSLLKEEVPVPKIEPQELAKVLKERKERLEEKEDEKVTKPQFPDSLLDIFKTLGQKSPKGLRMPNSAKNRATSNKKRKMAKASARGR
jgi:hypothetical protein